MEATGRASTVGLDDSSVHLTTTVTPSGPPQPPFPSGPSPSIEWSLSTSVQPPSYHFTMYHVLVLHANTVLTLVQPTPSPLSASLYYLFGLRIYSTSTLFPLAPLLTHTPPVISGDFGCYCLQ